MPDAEPFCLDDTQNMVEIICLWANVLQCNMLLFVLKLFYLLLNFFLAGQGSSYLGKGYSFSWLICTNANISTL